MDEFLSLTLFDTAKLLEKKIISPVELIDRCIKQALKTEQQTNAYIEIFINKSKKVAKKVEKEIYRGNKKGLLHGIPISLKDNINVKGYKTTAGSKVLKDNISNKDATVVKNLKSVGAIFLGKNNLHEFAWGATNINEFYGTVKNPWDETRLAGGSSGGSAVAVSARTCFGSIGTDTGGSIRIPAAINGLVGIRPTYGNVSNGGVIPLAKNMDTVGPIARTVKDCAILFQGIKKNHTKEKYTSLKKETIKGLKIGIIKDYFYYAQPDIVKSVKNAINTFKALGAEIRFISVENIKHLNIVKNVIQFSEASHFHKKWINNSKHKYGIDVRERLKAGFKYLATDYIEANKQAAKIKSELMTAFNLVDAIITPTIPFTAPKLNDHYITIDGNQENIATLFSYYTSLASVTGLPAISIPCGFDDHHLPIGCQLIGKPFQENVLFTFGEAFQKVTDFHLRIPKTINDQLAT